MLFCACEHLSSDLDLAPPVFYGIGKARRFGVHSYGGLFAFSFTGAPLAEISLTKKDSGKSDKNKQNS